MKRRKRASDAVKTNWKRESFMSKNPSYEEKIRHLEYKIHTLVETMRLSEKLLVRHFPKREKYGAIEDVISILGAHDKALYGNHYDSNRIPNFQEGEMLKSVNDFYDYLRGKKNMPNFSGGPPFPNLSDDMAWEVIYMLQEGLRVLPDHIERCDGCGELYDTWSEGQYSELDGKSYCGGCADSSETTYCDECGEDVWKDKSYDEDSGDYLCENCKRKRSEEEAAEEDGDD
jgi:hypothetical protein